MKKFQLAIILLTITGVVFSFSVLFTPNVSALDVTPTIEPTPTTQLLPVNDTPCDGTVYPPNSTCYSKVKANKIERVGVKLIDSNESILTYPLTCIPPPTVVYMETGEGEISDLQLLLKTLPRVVTVTSDVSDAQLGFLGPDSDTLANSNPDALAKKYLFNALFDRPGADPEATKESFRTYWRMLDSLSQAKVKAYFIEKYTDHIYYYVGQDKKQHEVKVSKLKSDLRPKYNCLSTFGIEVNNFFIDCWEDEKYLDQYTQLGKDNPQLREEYDQLLPFDFNSKMGYLSNGFTTLNEKIPYLQAIISGLKGYRQDIPTPIFIPGFGFVEIPNTVIPGLFDYYTPAHATRPLAQYPQLGDGLNVGDLFQYPIIEAVSLANNLAKGSLSYCDTSKSSSISAPKTYPKNSFGVSSDLTQTVVISDYQYTQIKNEPDKCSCKIGDIYCSYRSCNTFVYSPVACVIAGCNFSKGEKTYELTGTGTGVSTTVFNNPDITSLTDLVVGGKYFFNSTSKFSLAQSIIDIINKFSDKLISPVQPSFYKMLIPDFASESASPKTLVSAPKVDTSVSPPLISNANTTVTVSGSDTIYRENNLAQDTMHLLQNCWLVPSDQQSSSKCGKAEVFVGECALSEEPLTGVCSKDSFSKYAAEYASSGFGSTLSSFSPLVSPELSAVYAEAEKQTGVSCVILAAVHFMEGSNNPCQSLISGRKIGDPEPDKGGKIYNTLLETAIDAANELKAKGVTGTSFHNVITAMSNYNGGGNSNCRIDWTLPNNIGITPQYSIASGHCPPSSATTRYGDFPGEDDPYATGLLGAKHEFMYLRCTRDHYCGAVLPFNRPGAFTVALNYYNSLP